MKFYTVVSKLKLGKLYTYVMENNLGSKNPYHNNFHLESVTEMAYNACLFYEKSSTGNSDYPIMDINVIRIIIAACLFHDFNHTGGESKNDDINIANAKDGFSKFILENPDMFNNKEISNIIKLIDCTRYPYIVDNSDLDLIESIIRDSDILQGLFCQNYIDGVVRGLSKEIGIPFQTMLEGQKDFYNNMIFATEWAKNKKDSKIGEIFHLVNFVTAFSK